MTNNGEYVHKMLFVPQYLGDKWDRLQKQIIYDICVYQHLGSDFNPTKLNVP